MCIDYGFSLMLLSVVAIAKDGNYSPSYGRVPTFSCSVLLAYLATIEWPGPLVENLRTYCLQDPFRSCLFRILGLHPMTWHSCQHHAKDYGQAPELLCIYEFCSHLCEDHCSAHRSCFATK